MLRGYSENDFIGQEGLQDKDLLWAKYPNDKDIEKLGIRGIFMGNYLYWDSEKNLKKAKELGFKENPYSI